MIEIDSDITEDTRAESRRDSSPDTLRLLLAGAGDYAIFMLDPDGRIVTWSASGTRLTGYDEVDVVGASFDILFDHAAVARGEPAALLADAASSGLHVEGERLRKDGSRFWAVGTLTPVRHDDGALRGYVAVIHDGTERRRAEEKFRGLLESAPDAMIGVSPEGRIVFANTMTERLFGYHRGDLLGQPVEILLPPHVRTAHVGHRGRFIAQPTVRPMGAGLPLTALRQDGTEFPVDVSLSTLQTDDGMTALATIRDISDRRRAQQAIEDLNAELRRTNDELEVRVASRTASLTAQAAQLRASNAELDAFSYSVSHDLRAPLRAMDGFAKILSVRYADVLDDAGCRYLNRVRDAAQHMGRLIDGLLAFSKLQRQSLTRRSVDMTALCRTIWSEMVSERMERDARLTVEELPEAHADIQLLRHVLTNLLSNALKYTRVRNPALITVASTIDERGDVVYLVRDNGIGFDMKYADKLFQVFQRLHRAEDYEGTGIGLALAARIIQRHGGRIWAESNVDSGATFFFVLPENVTDQAAEQWNVGSAAEG